jgi:hypothetical protein
MLVLKREMACFKLGVLGCDWLWYQNVLGVGRCNLVTA